jgi:hypothetical protein
MEILVSGLLWDGRKLLKENLNFFYLYYGDVLTADPDVSDLFGQVDSKLLTPVEGGQAGFIYWYRQYFNFRGCQRCY